MKHYIIAKFVEGTDVASLISPVTDIFEGTLQVPGVHGVRVKPCCIARPNRYDIMIEIEMDKEALEAYGQGEAHKTWKQEYGALLQAKTICDSEE